MLKSIVWVVLAALLAVIIDHPHYGFQTSYDTSRRHMTPPSYDASVRHMTPPSYDASVRHMTPPSYDASGPSYDTAVI